ncbi:MAG: ECF-type sigma factor [Planctomycetes bacterium]|nr:ECF-type sigma factor [Planctomycetota bacterium]
MGFPAERGSAGRTGVPAPREATQWLQAAAGGDSRAAERAFEAVYAELRARAAQALRGERAGHTLQPTSLVHEAFLRIVKAEGLEVRTRDQFLALAARAMRRVLVDHARARARRKRGGGRERVPLDSLPMPLQASEGADLQEVDRALEALGRSSERQERVVELRFFAGLSASEAARVLGVSQATVERDWRAARAWLANRLRL